MVLPYTPSLFFMPVNSRLENFSGLYQTKQLPYLLYFLVNALCSNFLWYKLSTITLSCAFCLSGKLSPIAYFDQPFYYLFNGYSLNNIEGFLYIRHCFRCCRYHGEQDRVCLCSIRKVINY